MFRHPVKWRYKTTNNLWPLCWSHKTFNQNLSSWAAPCLRSLSSISCIQWDLISPHFFLYEHHLRGATALHFDFIHQWSQSKWYFDETYWLDVLKLCRGQRSPGGRCRESLSLRGGGSAGRYPITGRLLPWICYWCLGRLKETKVSILATLHRRSSLRWLNSSTIGQLFSSRLLETVDSWRNSGGEGKISFSANWRDS